MCESCPMLGFSTKKKKTSRFSQAMEVYSVFVGFVTQLCKMCVCRAWTCVYTQSSLSVFITLGTAVWSSLHSGVIFRSKKLTFYLHHTILASASMD